MTEPTEKPDRIEEEREMSEWQPIETAPKDGVDILVWGPNLGHLVVSYDGDANEDFPWMTLDGPSYWSGALLCWMPLPKPPQ